MILHPLVNTVKECVAANHLFTSQDKLLLAVSGGMDSMVLWQVLLQLGYQPGILHCNFQLRGAESAGDEVFVEAYAAQTGCPLWSKRFDTENFAQDNGISIQMAARELRYTFFEEIRSREGYDYILTAHHLDDRLETFWLNFSRGTGLKGLVALSYQSGKLRRPLLAVNRQAIAQYQADCNIPFREDSSNEKDAYQRNAFRHHVLPALYQWMPDMAQRAMTNFSRLEEMWLLEQEAVKAFVIQHSSWVGDTRN
ncbi:MAG: tRNA lysidine(34) synthetase TilS [Saprospiraceae bacterium]